MAVAQRSGALVSGTTASSTSPVVNAPVGVQTGDLMIYGLSTSTSNGPTINSGWTLIANLRPTSDASRMVLVWRIRQSGDGSTYTPVTYTGANIAKYVGDAFTGHDATTPISTSISTLEGASAASSMTLSAITTAINNALLILFAHSGTNNRSHSGQTSPLVEHVEVVSNPVHISYATGVQVSAGSSGTKSVTFSGSTTYAGALFYINEAAGGVTEQGAASLAGEAAITAIGFLMKGGVASLSGDAQITALALRTKFGISALQGDTQITAGGQRIIQGAVSLSGDAQIVAIPFKQLFGVSSLSGDAQLSAVARMEFSGVANLQGDAVITATGGKILSGVAPLEGLSVLTGTAYRIVSGIADLQGNAILIGAVTTQHLAQAVLVGDSQLTSLGQKMLLGVGGLQGDSQLSGSGQKVVGGLAVIAGDASLTAQGLLIIFSARELESVGHYRFGETLGPPGIYVFTESLTPGVVRMLQSQRRSGHIIFTETLAPSRIKLRITR